MKLCNVEDTVSKALTFQVTNLDSSMDSTYNTFVCQLMSIRFISNSPLKVYRRLVVFVTCFGTVWTPSAIVFVDSPFTTSFPFVPIRQTRPQRILFVTLDISPIFWTKILESIAPLDSYIVIESIKVISITGENIRFLCLQTTKQHAGQEEAGEAKRQVLHRSAIGNWPDHAVQNLIQV